MSEKARRRSQRVDLSIPVRFSVGDKSFDSATLIVSRHGALVRCPFLVSVGTTVPLKNLANGEETPFRVAWVWPDEGDSPGFKLGLEMVETRISFWGSRYERRIAPLSAD